MALDFYRWTIKSCRLTSMSFFIFFACPIFFSLFPLPRHLRVYPFLSLPFLHSCLLESECFCRRASTFSREIFLSKVFVYIDMRCVCACVCVCVFFFHFKVLCLAVPNGMGVEAGDALLDEGPQSLPAMRLWTFFNFRSSDSRENRSISKFRIGFRWLPVIKIFVRCTQYHTDRVSD